MFSKFVVWIAKNIEWVIVGISGFILIPTLILAILSEWRGWRRH